MSAGHENNLLNIRAGQPAYEAAWRRIERELPDDLRQILDAAPQLSIIATDAYFLHYALYPQLRPDQNPDRALEAARQGMEEYTASDRYRALRRITELDHDLSTVYGLQLAEALAEELRKEMERQLQRQGQPDPKTQLQQMIAAAQGGDKKAQQKLRALAQAALQDMTQKGGQRMKKALAKAQKKAEKRTQAAKQLKDLGVAAGDEPGEFRRLLDLSKKVMEVSGLQDIITMAERLVHRLPRFTHRKKVKGRFGDEVAGYRTTHNPARALARELALPEEMFLQKLAGGGFLTREKRTTVEGAYYILIDKSGSMSGTKTVWARSVALALYRLAKQKGRRYFVRFFDTRCDELITYPADVVGYLLTIESGGGTSIDTALSTALRDLRERGLASLTNTIILITDGEDTVNTTRRDLRAANATLVSVMIQGDNRTLRAISDQYLRATLTDEGGLRVLEVSE